MKTRFLGTILVVAMALAGCGGAPPAAGEPDICAMNPIAHGCGIESVQGAVAGGFKTTPTVRYLGSYICSNQPFLYDLSATMITARDFYTSRATYWETQFDSVTWASPLPTRFSLQTRNGAARKIYMAEGMDGPYHILYNPYASANYGLVQAPGLNAGYRPVIIPPYGIFVYAPNERPDYPNGAEVVTIDPDYSIPFVSGDGRCPERKQFITSL